MVFLAEHITVILKSPPPSSPSTPESPALLLLLLLLGKGGSLHLSHHLPPPLQLPPQLINLGAGSVEHLLSSSSFSPPPLLLSFPSPLRLFPPHLSLEVLPGDAVLQAVLGGGGRLVKKHLETGGGEQGDTDGGDGGDGGGG